MTIGPAKALAVVGLVFWLAYILMYVTNIPDFLGDAGTASVVSQLLFGAYGYLTLLVGVFLGSGYQMLKAEKAKGKTRVKITKLLPQAVRNIDFWIGLFVSPLIYAILLQAVDLETIDAASVFSLTLIGLQNGYVCNTVADSFFTNAGATPDSA